MSSRIISRVKLILILTIAICIENICFSQAEPPSIIPPSPRSREFEKFINFKVSLYNGLPETGINFYTIELDGVKIPIGISYHASGIRFGQTSGDVGIGWALNPAYRISRTVHGRLDEAYTMPDMNNVANGQTIGYYLNNAFSSPFQRDLYLARYINQRPGEAPAIAASQNDYLDGEFDLFTMGLPEQNGNFIITDRVNKVVSMLNNNALQKINYTLDNIGISLFNVTDANANQYKFGENSANNEGLQVYVNGAYRKYSTAWMLSEINTPFNNKINFAYQLITEASDGTPTYNRTLIEGLDVGNICQPTTDNNGVVTPAQGTNYDTKVLSSISTPNEIITVNRNTNSTVSSILITKPGGAQIKRIIFYYSQPGSRIFLDSIHIAGTESTAIEKYSFDYTSRNISFGNYDCFGYSIAHDGGIHYYANNYGRYDYTRRCTGIPDHVIFHGLNKRLYPSSQAGMLKKITFPIGGTQEFFYQSNDYGTNPSPNVVGGGGLRIGSIINTDPIGGKSLTRSYHYVGPGIRTVDPTDPNLSMTQKVILGDFFDNNHHVRSIIKTVHASTIDAEITEATNQSNQGWYRYVTENYGNGKVEYKFEIPFSDFNVDKYPTNQSGQSRPFHPYYLTSYNFWNKPYLSEKTIFKIDETAGPKQIQKERYEYFLPSPSPTDEFIGLKVSPFALVGGYNLGVQTSEPTFSLYNESGISSVFNYATYKITKGEVLLSKKIITNYDNAPETEITTISEYNYTTGNLISSEKITNSKGEILQTNYKYPISYEGLTGIDNISAGIKKLRDINLITPVIEKASYRANINGSNKQLINAQFTSYKPTLPVPDKVFTTEINTLSNTFIESNVQGGSVTKDDNKYREQISFDSYSATGKLYQQSKFNNVKEVFLWGYNSQYPVVKVTGSDYNTVKSFVNQSILDNPATTDANMRTELNKIRTGLASTKALVWTFTYSPLIGITSETDPNGNTTFYEYDHFSRLMHIKDKNGNILKIFNYKYQIR